MQWSICCPCTDDVWRSRPLSQRIAGCTSARRVSRDPAVRRIPLQSLLLISQYKVTSDKLPSFVFVTLMIEVKKNVCGCCGFLMKLLLVAYFAHVSGIDPYLHGSFHYGPQTKFWYKVMFLHLSVSHSVHGGRGGVCPIACWDTPPGRHSLLILWDTVNKQAVRILLECILVTHYSSKLLICSKVV